MTSIFPNPASEKLRIESIKIYSVLGEKVFISNQEAGNRHEVTIDTSAFPAGICFVEIKSTAFTEVKKLIIEK